MSERFDPYHKWLGIPPAEQPPNHYRLLAIRAFEDDADVIETAADQRMAHLRRFQSGEYSQLSQKLLNEVSQARVCLLNPAKKRAYDEQLRAATAPPRKPAARQPGSASAPVVVDVEDDDRDTAALKNPVMLGAAAAGVLVLVVVLALVLWPSDEPEQVASQDTPDDVVSDSIENDTPPAERTVPNDDERPVENVASPPADALPEDVNREPVPVVVVPPPDSTAQPSPTDPADAPAPVEPPAAEQPSPAVEPPARTAQKHALPSDEQQAEIRKQIEEIYDLTAAQSAAQQVELAGKLLALAAESKESPKEQYVLLQQAVDLAHTGGDAALMLRAIDAMDEAFQIDGQQLRQTRLIAFAESARTEAPLRSLIGVYDTHVTAAIDDDRLDDALSLVTAVNSAALRQRDREIRKTIYDRRREVQLIFGRRVTRRTPSRFRTRVLTADVTPTLHVDCKHSRIKQYHKEGRALRTETTINDTRDFDLPKGLHHLSSLRNVGFQANRRLLDVQSLGQDPQIGEAAFRALTSPVHSGMQRGSGLRFGDPVVMALLGALLVFRLLPRGFANRDLREHLAPLLGERPSDITPGRMTYQLRRLKLHGLIERLPGSHRYRVTDLGVHACMFYTRAYHRQLRPALASGTSPPPDTGTRQQRALHQAQHAVDNYIETTKVAA